MGAVISFDEDAYNNICSKLSDVSGQLSGCQGLATSSPLGGKLLSYYNSSCNTDIGSGVASAANDIGALCQNIKASINVYKNTDESLFFELDDIINEIFSLNFDNPDMANMDLDERQIYIDNIIKKYEQVYEDFKNKYIELYGDGIEFNKQKAFEMLNLFSALGMFVGPSNSNYDEGGLYKEKNGNFYLDINQMAAFIKELDDRNIISSVKDYLNGVSWRESGMEKLFGDNLIDYYNFRHENDIIDDVKLTDSELIFLENYINGCYGTMRKAGSGDYSEFNNDFGQFVQDLIMNDSTDMSDLEIFDDTFFADMTGYKVLDKKSAKYYILKYLNSKDILGTIDSVKNKSDECQKMQNDLMVLSNTIYNYKQAALLMPFETYMNDYEYQDYLEKDYSNYNLIDSDKRDYLTAKEIALYDFIYNKSGKDVADKYLEALSDTINNRKGMIKALEYVNSLDKDGYHFDDEITAMLNGFADGNMNFIQGLERFYNPTGTRSVLDYIMFYKVGLLDNPEQYGLDLNLNATERKALTITYNIFSGVGNMFIPQAVGLTGGVIGALTNNPVVANTFSKISKLLMFQSVTGNATNNAMAAGYGMLGSYLYGGLAGASEVLFESLGGIMGIGDDVNLLNLSGLDFVKGYVKSMLQEGREEFLQEYFDAGIRALLLGEPLDLENTTKDALIAGLYGMAVAGVMNSYTIPIKIGGKIINLSYENLCEIDFNEINSLGDLKNTLQSLEIHEIKIATEKWINTELKDVLKSFLDADKVDALDLSKIIIFETEEEYINFMKSKFPSFVYNHSGGVHFMNDGTIVINLHGFGINSMADAMGIIIHENIHELGNIMENAVLIDKLGGLNQLNEALTELFTKNFGLSDKYGNEYGYRTSYDNGVDGLWYLFQLEIPGLSMDDFKNAYFEKNSIKDIASTIDDIMGEGFFNDEFLSAFESKDYLKIQKVMRKIAMAYNSGGS